MILVKTKIYIHHCLLKKHIFFLLLFIEPSSMKSLSQLLTSEEKPWDFIFQRPHVYISLELKKKKIKYQATIYFSISRSYWKKYGYSKLYKLYQFHIHRRQKSASVHPLKKQNSHYYLLYKWTKIKIIIVPKYNLFIKP